MGSGRRLRNAIGRHRPSPGTALGLAALIVALGGVAFAAIPDSNGTIHACYQAQNGDLRVVDGSGDCRKSERSLEWNQRGSPGPPGPPGPGGDAHVLDRTTLADGQTKDIFTKGPFTITAACNLSVPQSVDNFFLDRAKIVFSTTEAHSASSVSGNADIGPSTPEDQRFLASAERFHLDVGNHSNAGYDTTHFTISAPSGTDIGGGLFASVNAFGHPGACVFGGYLVYGS